MKAGEIMKTWIVKFTGANGRIQLLQVRAREMEEGDTADSYIADGITYYVSGSIISIVLA